MFSSVFIVLKHIFLTRMLKLTYCALHILCLCQYDVFDNSLLCHLLVTIMTALYVLQVYFVDNLLVVILLLCLQ